MEQLTITIEGCREREIDKMRAFIEQAFNRGVNDRDDEAMREMREYYLNNFIEVKFE